MRRILRTGLALAAIVSILSSATLSFAGNPVDVANFSDQQYGSGYGQITGLTWGARGGNNYLFVCNRNGQIYVIKNGTAQAGVLTTVSPCYTGDGEVGLESIITDVDFGGGHPQVYIYVTEASGNPGPARMHAYDFADNGTTVSISNKRQVGPTMTTHGVNHNGGGITQDSNGVLYAGVGNNNNGINEGGHFVGSGTSQVNTNELNSLGSKVVRFNRDSSPAGAANFMAMTGNTRYIWARGFRNPFGLRIRPNSGNQLWMSQVGDGWEQIFHITENSNQQWPTENNTNTGNGLLVPKFAYNTGGSIGNCLTRHVFYDGNTFPAAYQGNIFFCEYGSSRIYRGQMNGDNIVSASVAQFITGANGPTDINVGPDGALYYGSSGNGQVRRVFYNGSAVPIINTQPANQIVNEPATATFGVTAAGTALSYQWQRQAPGSATWANVGGNSASYTTPATLLTDNGAHYRVTVSNAAGSITSNGAATLTVNARPPVISPQPQSQTVTAGTSVTFTAGATGSATLTYQWQSRPSAAGTFSNIGGATASTYTFANPQTANSGMQFQVIVDNPAPGTVTSNIATLTVNAGTVAPTIAGQPANATVTQPATATFTVTATGTNLTYQWQSHPAAGGAFVSIGGATAASYTTAATDVGMSGTVYQVVVSNSVGTATSNSVTLTVNGVAAATPVIMPNGGTYSGPVTVRITTATAGAMIHYTTNNTAPTAASPTALPFVVSANATVRAIAVPSTSANSNSAEASAVFTITGNVPYGMAYRDPTAGITITSAQAGLPATLSATGIFQAPVANLTPNVGVIPFGVNNPLWSDGAAKKRWIILPGNQKIVFAATGEWAFPAGTILVKHFDLGARKLETRVFYVNQAGGSYGATYKWNTGGTEADLLPGTAPLDEVVGTQTWTYPSRADCMTCHNDAARIVLGPKTRQLNGAFAYPGGASDNQLRTWNYLGMFSTTLTETAIPGYSKLVAVNDINATLENAVRSYLDSNCGNCHRPQGGAGRAQWDGRYDTATAATGIVDGQVFAETLGLAAPRIVAPADTANSVLLQRMLSTTAPIRMPALGSHVVDPEATLTVTAWINSLTPTTTPPPTTPPPTTPPPGGTPGGGNPAPAAATTSGSKDHMCGIGSAGSFSLGSLGVMAAAALALLLTLRRR